MTIPGAFNLQQTLPDPIMSNIAMERMGTGDFIADRIAPVVGVTSDYGRYCIYGSDALFPASDLKRAPGESAVLGSMSRSWDTFTCTEDAHRMELHEEDFQGQNPQSVRVQAIDTNIVQIKIAIETRLNAFVVAIANTLNVATKWDQSSDFILRNWLDAKEAFRHQFGIYPNTAIVTPTIGNLMATEGDIKDFVKRGDPVTALEEGILPKRLFNVDIVVPSANVKVSLQAAAALADIWDNGEKSVSFLYVCPLKYDINANKSSLPLQDVNSFALQIRSTADAGLTIATRQWVETDQSKKTEHISCDMKQVEKVVNDRLGMRFQVLT